MTLTFKNDAQVMKHAAKHFNAMLEHLKKDTGGEWSCMAMFQPMPTLFFQHGTDRGGNILGLDSESENLICKSSIELPGY